ncbi:phage holin family protein [Pseudomonas sp. R1-18]|uniref:phage holin family protein n=1 Tax=Pseudomonas sp. R1-18 TaxID=1632772 RepID=UPI003DA7D4FF
MNEFLQWVNAVAIWLDSVIPDVLLGTRGTCHLLIFLVVAGYQSGTAKHRKLIGAIAAAFAGANAAEAYRVAVNFNQFSAVVQPPLTLVMLCVLFFVIYARGNVARMLPRSFTDMIR